MYPNSEARRGVLPLQLAEMERDLWRIPNGTRYALQALDRRRNQHFISHSRPDTSESLLTPVLHKVKSKDLPTNTHSNSDLPSLWRRNQGLRRAQARNESPWRQSEGRLDRHSSCEALEVQVQGPPRQRTFV